jgi:hypothetical protein
MARQKKELTDGTAPAEAKKAKRTDFMKFSTTIRTNRTFTNEQFKGLALTSIKRIEDNKALNEIAEQALQRIDDIKLSLIEKQKAIIAKAQEEINKLEGKQ